MIRGLSSGVEVDPILYWQRWFVEAVEILPGVGDQREKARTLWWLAATRGAQGEYSEAIDCLSKAIQIHTEIGYKRGIAVNLWGLGQIHSKLDHHNDAISLFLEAAQVYEEIGESEKAAYGSREAAKIRKSLEKTM